MAYDEALAARMRAALAGRSDVEEKRMFGGLSFIVAGQMCCGVIKDEMVVRIDDKDFASLVDEPNVRPFDFSGRPMQGMVYVKQSVLKSDTALSQWVQRGVSWVESHPRTAKPAKRR